MHSIDSQGKLLKVSRFWAAKLGYDLEEMIGRASTDFLTEDSRIKAKQKILPEFFRTGALHNVEYDFVRKDGELLTVLMSAIAQYDNDGAFERSLAVMFDNTETRKIREQVRHNQRMEAVGQLVGGVAHDFNNLLTVVQGNLEFLRDDPDHPDRDSFLSDALRASRRGASLTHQLLSYGRRQTLKPKVEDLSRIVLDLDGMVRRLLPDNIQMDVVAGGGLWPVMIDRHQLDTALINLLNNARDAMKDGGKLTIETCNVRLSEEYVQSREETIRPGRYVMLAITDTGSGISRDDIRHVFEPYFTTKPPGVGSGLGLAMVFGFVKQSEGAIRVYSEFGYGTTFRLYFPADAGAHEEASAPPPEAIETAQTAEVLLVEDEDEVRRVLLKQLTQAGLRVTAAGSGDDAFGLLTAGVVPQVMITDVVMPGSLQGPELAERARGLIPDLQVIFVSGYPQEAAIHGNGIGANDLQLVKPVDRDRLVRTVNRFMERATA